MNLTISHYDLLIDEGNDPVHDPKPLRDYMDKWDGDVFFKNMKLDKNKCVLEIGIGTGRLAIKAAPLCKKLTGVDISPKTIQKAKCNLSSFDNINLICGDFLEMSFDEQYDVIYSSLTFMHIKDKQSAIIKVYSLLKTGGVFVLSIDKNQEKYIDYGTRKIEVYPDNKDDIIKLFDGLLHLEKISETEHAYIFTATK